MRIASSIFVLILSAELVVAAGFVETFSGEGEYSSGGIAGFENPDWEFTSEDFTDGRNGEDRFDDGVFSVTSGGLFARDNLKRPVSEIGSFKQRIVVKNLSLAPKDCSGFFFCNDSILAFNHDFDLEDSLGSVSLILQTGWDVPEEKMRLSGRIDGTNISISTDVDRATEVAMGL